MEQYVSLKRTMQSLSKTIGTSILAPLSSDQMDLNLMINHKQKFRSFIGIISDYWVTLRTKLFLHSMSCPEKDFIRAFFSEIFATKLYF
jgi:hypothetical protein